jgi:hypothetical protein
MYVHAIVDFFLAVSKSSFVAQSSEAFISTSLRTCKSFSASGKINQLCMSTEPILRLGVYVYVYLPLRHVCYLTALQSWHFTSSRLD